MGGLLAMYAWRSVYWSEQVSSRTRALLMIDWIVRYVVRHFVVWERSSCYTIILSSFWFIDYETQIGVFGVAICRACKRTVSPKSKLRTEVTDRVTSLLLV